MYTRVRTIKTVSFRLVAILALVALLLSTMGGTAWADGPDERVRVIIQARDVAAARAWALGRGGDRVRDLRLINAVRARLSRRMLARLQRIPGIRIYEDRQVILSDSGTGRVAQGLQVLYTFEEGAGAEVRDLSGVGTPLDLAIAHPENVTWLPGGGLSIDASTIVQSAGPASKVIDAVKLSGEVTIEAWLRPDNTTQFGPARIVTLSQDPYYRNATLGQSYDGYGVRFRTTTTGDNGMLPELEDDIQSVAMTATA